ncbi:MAG: 3-phosphoglycerate dehydrogenase [Bacteroidetes bacterium]|nr:MAG: 3-phosphoglycerate dehydrogenase [Bacteroidota bacterium]
MIKILANDGIHPDGKMLLEEAGYQVDTEKVAQEDLMDVLPNYDAIIVRSATKVRKDLIDGCPNLKVIARAGVGLDNIDHDYARDKGLAVINTPAASSQSVAELAFGHMFSLARQLQNSNWEMRNLEEGKFKKLKKQYSTGFQLRGKTLGIIGFGRIGIETARIGLGLGMKVLPYDIIPDLKVDVDVSIYQSEEASLTIKLKSVELDELLANSDFISLHIPTSDRPVIGKAEIEKLKDGVILVNTARGNMIDEEALIEGLESGKIGGAALDVFVNEPNPNEAILQHPKIALSPHIGGSTVEAQTNIGLELADKIIAHFGH